MGQEVKKPEYTGLDKYPGIIATIITLVIGGVFLGALFTVDGAAAKAAKNHCKCVEEAAGDSEKVKNCEGMKAELVEKYKANKSYLEDYAAGLEKCK